MNKIQANFFVHCESWLNLDWSEIFKSSEAVRSYCTMDVKDSNLADKYVLKDAMEGCESHWVYCFMYCMQESLKFDLQFFPLSLSCGAALSTCSERNQRVGFNPMVYYAQKSGFLSCFSFVCKEFVLIKITDCFGLKCVIGFTWHSHVAHTGILSVVV